jgi:ligand-binding SRPBCC domain-containing protein
MRKPTRPKHQDSTENLWFRVNLFKRKEKRAMMRIVHQAPPAVHPKKGLGTEMHFHFTSFVKATPAAVMAFHERPDAIVRLRPPWQPMQVLRRQGGLEAGAEVEFRVWMGPVPVRWLARHIAFEPGRSFTDVQVHGPFRSWVHTHRFVPQGEGTLLSDEIECSLPGAPVSDWLFGWTVRLQLTAMFRYRHAVTRRFCERGR